MTSTLKLFVLQSYTINDASDVLFTENIICITRDEYEAYAHFAHVFPDTVGCWEYVKQKKYTELSQEEKKEALYEMMMGTAGYFSHHGAVIHTFPIENICGIEHLLSPYKKRIRTLENQQRTDAFVRTTRDPGTGEDRLPKEIVDTIITPMLNE